MRKKLRHSTLLFCFILITIIVLPLFLVALNVGFDEQQSGPEFFVGVEYAIDNHSVEGCKQLVDRVKNFTNLFVVDSVGITFDKNNLNEVCDYVYDSGLYFMVFFISLHYQQEDGDLVFRYNYYPHMWIAEAKEKYGDKFLGAYAMDEPGGNQLDAGSFQLVKEAENQTEAATTYLEWLYIHINYYLYAKECEGITVLTSDYGLYWFDYKSGYDAVLAEFAWNHSRPLHVALCRGAATVQNKEWGAMVTWTYNDEPYIVSGDELYDDLITAYHNGAKYVVIFNHPDTDYSEYGILMKEHFDALETFWNYVNSNPDKHGTVKAEAAYVLPENFGFGFRNPNDNIWGLWSADTDERTEKIWGDVNQLLDEYGFSLDIVYSDPAFNDDLQRHYDKVFFWNETIN
ncbi:MAG TPA: hypothetical protein ENN36_04210 [Candidatus Bathyarchaeota archaeon]|nr:hypothetical protein [Candidatus Bathyarchaeota archaeon]